MMKIDNAVKRETVYIATWELIFSALMHAVFLATGKWNMTVLYGNLLSASFAILNFFLLGITVQKAVEKNDEKAQRNTIKTSHSLRTVMLFAVAAIGAVLDCFNIWAAVLPLLFPRIAIMFRSFSKK